MSNHVSIDPKGIICPTLEGDQDGTSISQLITKTTAIAHEFQAQNPEQPLRFLVTMRNIGSHTLPARQVGAKALRTMPYYKVAIVGAHRFIRHTVALIIMAAGKNGKVKQFHDEASAIAWLME